MPLGTVEIKRFGGLNLSSDPDDAAFERALVATNVDIAPDRTFFRTRDGAVRLGAVAAMGASRIAYRLVPEATSGGVDGMLAIAISGSTTVEAFRYTPLGAVTLAGTWAVASFKPFFDSVSFGSPTGSLSFISQQVELMRRVAPGGAPVASVGRPRYVGVTPTSNRLVQARFLDATDSPTGANGSKSTVFFSDAGAPETFSANNYVHLRPGDNEDIRGVATWRGQTFVFKETSAYVFSGESVSSTGTPVFDYREITLAGRILPVGLDLFGAVVASNSDGVYYLAADGLYRTTGGPPVRVSAPIDELLRTGSVAPQFISASGSRVFIHSSFKIYVFDSDHGQWTVWTSPVNAPSAPFVQWPASAVVAGSPRSIMWCVSHTMYRTSHSAYADDNQELGVEYTTGYSDLGSPALSDLGSPALKTVTHAEVWGKGRTRLRVSSDHAAYDGATLAPMVLGVSPSQALSVQRRARRGKLFSLSFESVAGAGVRVEVDNVVLGVRRPRAIGSKL